MGICAVFSCFMVMYSLCGSVIIYTRVRTLLCQFRCVRTQTRITLRDLLQMGNGFFEPTRTQLVCSELQQIREINSTSEIQGMWCENQWRNSNTPTVHFRKREKKECIDYMAERRSLEAITTCHMEWTSVDMEIFYHNGIRKRMHRLFVSHV